MIELLNLHLLDLQLTMFWYTFGETQLSLHVYFLTQVNKGRKLTYDDKHSMKGAIKVREYL